MGRCGCCDLSRIRKQFEAKQKNKLLEILKTEPKAEPVVMVVDKSQPTKTKKKKTESKSKVEESQIEVSEEKIETSVEDAE